ncbi:glutathione S-transferase [Vibrio albus]|uniref:Glutathione S-transferase n=2 Tax=Vibrio albus TaxID=2200953 RepID=A0A2U3BAM9_9VIBR|nr:glutathione S-transferase [Vibrio albus]
MKLYGYPTSGHTHKAQLFLSLLKLDFEFVNVDLLSGEHKQASFLALNPFGQVPVLVDGEDVIADSNAILVYLARTYDPTGQWLPEDPMKHARVEQFLSTAAHRLAGSAALLRAANLFSRTVNKPALLESAHLLFSQLNDYLQGKDWLVDERVTIADVAFYTYTKVAPEGDVDLSGYPSILSWLNNVEALDGFVDMPSSGVGLRAS